MKLWNKYKNNIIKFICYFVIICILLVCFNFNFHNLFKLESSVASAQVSENLMGVVTNDSFEIVGTVNRAKPSTFGIYSASEYPSSINILSVDDITKRTDIYNENKNMYDDIELAIQENRLMKHVAADGQFYGTISEDVPGIIKKVYVNASVKRDHSLGVYAPAGEILTLEISEELINKGIQIIIGYVKENNNIPLDKFLVGNKDRMPIIHKTFNITSTITKLGTPLGGNVYITVPDSVSENFEVTISGGVDNPVFQLGVNTQEDYEQMLEAPGLIMEFKLPHVRLIMPKAYAINDGNIIKSLELWHKMSSLSTYAMNRVNNTLPISQYYDSYVPAGAAVAFQYAWFSILPLSWAKGALSYENLMFSGQWGDFHEFNHHYQSMNYNSGNWGIGDTTEVTNNVLTTLGYILYTDIASTRSEGSAPGNGGWNVSTDPYYNLKTVLENSSNVTSFSELSTNQLYIYVELIHAFGTEKFMNFIRSSYGLYGDYEKNLMSDEDTFALRASKIFERDLTYFFVNICKMSLKEETLIAIKNLNYEPYLPLYNLYSNGIENIETGRAYYLNSSQYIFDFNKYTISSLNYEIKEIGKPKYGRLKRNVDGTYTYINTNYKEDEFYITYKIDYEGQAYLKKLKFVIDFSFNKVDINSYSTSIDDMSLAINDMKSENLISSSYSNSINYRAPNGNNISVSKGKLKVDKSGNYLFAIYGDDKIKFNINGKEAKTSTYTSSINLDNRDSYFTTYLEVGKFYDYSLYCLNNGGAGGANVKYSYENELNFVDIDNKYVYSSKANETNSNIKLNNYEIVYDVRENYIVKKYGDTSLNKIESIETNANSNGDTIVGNMFDGDKSTYYHTAWKSNITNFPHEYIIKFSSVATFDTINIYFNNGITYAIGNYEVYISDNNEEYILIKEDSNKKGTLIIDLDKDYQAKYLKLVVKSNASDKVFTSISEIEVGKKIEMNGLNYYASNDNRLHYIKNWKATYNNIHFNGVKTIANKKGRIEFNFYGTELALYTGSNSKYRIKIDNSKWKTIDDTSSEMTPSYINNSLKDEEHTVVIESLNDETSLELIAIRGELLSRNQYSLRFIEFYKIIGCIAIAILLVKGGLYIYENRRKIIKKCMEILKINNRINRSKNIE